MKTKLAVMPADVLMNLMIRYLDDKAGPPLNHDEREILLFALYGESVDNGGLARKALNALAEKARRTS